MSRIEKGTIKQEVEQLKGEMVKEIKHANQHSHSRLSCSLIFLVFFFVCVSAFTWMIASTGIVSIPWFSTTAFHQPKPDHLVAPGVPVETTLQEDIRTTLTKRLYEGRGKLTDTTMHLAIDERSLTASIRSAIEKAGIDAIDTTQTQIAVTETIGIEVFLPFQGLNQSTALKMHVRLIPTEELVEFSVEKAWLGSLQIPNVLIEKIIEPFVNNELPLNKTLGATVHISSVEYQQGMLIIDGNYTIEFLPL